VFKLRKIGLNMLTLTHLQYKNEVFVETGDDVRAGDGHPIWKCHRLEEGPSPGLFQGLQFPIQHLYLRHKSRQYVNTVMLVDMISIGWFCNTKI